MFIEGTQNNRLFLLAWHARYLAPRALSAPNVLLLKLLTNMEWMIDSFIRIIVDMSRDRDCLLAYWYCLSVCFLLPVCFL